MDDLYASMATRGEAGPPDGSPAEVAVHPAGAPTHEFYLMCDDVAATVTELTAKGVEFTKEVSDEGWGLLTAIRLPGGGELGLYEPRHAKAYAL